ncbi:IS3 family transposase [Micromonospora sp. U21]|uniref:IS3 family transposase n=1 Tax=Micromonospora sp. U21 TaxID=2824899 RepID=UPI001B36D264|nr:IS3 family transposase [Micromonospora sp. U21]MBQ0906974.1 IS3 family transposase [Micromonospora sp. U21]
MSVAAFIASQRTEHDVPHAVACRALGVSESWFYKWRGRPPTPRQDRRTKLTDAVRRVFDASGGTYGSPRIGDELREQGWRVSDNTIAQLMAELGLVARAKRRRRGLTRQGKRPAAPDLVKRQFTAPAPDVAWCGDMTEIATQEGKLYLATVIDLYSRHILGYAMGDRHDAGLVVAALNMAAVTRGGDVAGVIFHSDRGAQFRSRKFVKALHRNGLTGSMGRVGACGDIAAMESFFALLQRNVLDRQRWQTRHDLRLAIVTWIERTYHRRRRQRRLGRLTPIEFETINQPAHAA